RFYYSDWRRDTRDWPLTTCIPAGCNRPMIKTLLEKALFRRVRGRRGARRQTQPGQQVRDVPLDRVLAQPEALRDHGVAQSLRDEPQYLNLTTSERRAVSALLLRAHTPRMFLGTGEFRVRRRSQ